MVISQSNGDANLKWSLFSRCWANTLRRIYHREHCRHFTPWCESNRARAPLEGEEEVRGTPSLTLHNQGHSHQGPAPSRPPQHGHHTVNMGGAGQFPRGALSKLTLSGTTPLAGDSGPFDSSPLPLKVNTLTPPPPPPPSSASPAQPPYITGGQQSRQLKLHPGTNQAASHLLMLGWSLFIQRFA